MKKDLLNYNIAAVKVIDSKISIINKIGFYMKRLLYYFLVFTAFTKISAQNELEFNFDYARFNYDSTSVLLEIYYSFNQADLTVVENEGVSAVEAIIHIELIDSASGEYYLKKEWKVRNVLNNIPGDNNAKSLIGLVSIAVPTGVYNIVVEGRDFNNETIKKTLSDKIKIFPYPSEPSISDIELAGNILKDPSDMSSIFYKNTLEVTPNPSMVYSHSKPVMFYYLELYNLTDTAGNSNFKMEKLLFNSSGNMIYNKSKKIVNAQSSFVEYGVLNLAKYPTDSYNFIVTLVDTVLNKAIVSNKKFYLYNPDVVDTFTTSFQNTNFLSSEFGVYTEEECDYMFNVAKYVSMDDERKQYGSLDSLNAKREFLYNFWKLRDSDPKTARNEYKDEYMERAAYADKNFGNKYREGYKSDRGRVYLLYGEPDQRDRFPNERYLKPYEVWVYNSIEGGVEFIFADMTGFSNYELVHSTKRGELRDDNWSRRIATN